MDKFPQGCFAAGYLKNQFIPVQNHYLFTGFNRVVHRGCASLSTLYTWIRMSCPQCPQVYPQLRPSFPPNKRTKQPICTLFPVGGMGIIRKPYRTAAFGGAPHQSAPGSEEPGADSFSPRGEALSRVRRCSLCCSKCKFLPKASPSREKLSKIGSSEPIFD